MRAYFRLKESALSYIIYSLSLQWFRKGHFVLGRIISITPKTQDAT